jgi:hypothetical protein
MPVLTLDYRHCSRKRPLYIRNAEIECIASLAREQLVDAATDAIPMRVLSGISGLKINGIAFELVVDTGNVVHDEEHKPVLGVCEYDPGVPDTAMVSVSPAGFHASEELVLSTLGHEIGHAVFDAPGWIVDASKGPGLFDEPLDVAHRAYRTTTRDIDHLGKVCEVDQSIADKAASIPGQTHKDMYFAELRANEFMGSLLVPRQRLTQAVQELACKYRVRVRAAESLDPELPADGVHLTVEDDVEISDMDGLKRALAARFGVNRRFIEVRMQRYGLLRPQKKPG